MGVNGVSIIVADSDIRTRKMALHLLESEGYHVQAVHDSAALTDILMEQIPDLIILSDRVGGHSGYALCQHIRELLDTPIILVGTDTDGDDVAKALEAGADEYIKKPFSSREFLAKAKAAMRRVRPDVSECPTPFHHGALTVDFLAHRVFLHDEDVLLTAIEYRFLSYLAKNAGRVVTFGQLVERVWSEDCPVNCHLVHVNICRLRRKLGDKARNSTFISTRRGIGYMLIRDSR